MPNRFLDDLSSFLRTDAARRSGASGEDVVLQDRRNEGRLIGGALPPTMGPPAALGAGLAYEWGVKPGARLIQEAAESTRGIPGVGAITENLAGMIPEPFRHQEGVSSDSGFLSGLRRSLELARGASERTMPWDRF